MNWGNKIVLAFILFAAFIGYIVVRSFQQNIDLVAEDYYAQEINFQNKLNRLANAAESDKQVTVKQVGDQVWLTFPDSQSEGIIHFYHPSRKIFDRKFDIYPNKENVQKIDRSELIAGSYRVNISWKVENENYFQQSKIYIQ